METKGKYVNKKNYTLISNKFVELSISLMDEDERIGLLTELMNANMKKVNNPTLLEDWIMEQYGEKFFHDPKVAHLLKC